LRLLRVGKARCRTRNDKTNKNNGVWGGFVSFADFVVHIMYERFYRGVVKKVDGWGYHLDIYIQFNKINH